MSTIGGRLVLMKTKIVFGGKIKMKNVIIVSDSQQLCHDYIRRRGLNRLDCYIAVKIDQLQGLSKDLPVIITYSYQQLDAEFSRLIKLRFADVSIDLF